MYDITKEFKYSVKMAEAGIPSYLFQIIDNIRKMHDLNLYEKNYEFKKELIAELSVDNAEIERRADDRWTDWATD